MSYYVLETLTPVHIGTGRQFQGNFETLYFGEHNAAVVLDDRRVFDLVGPAGLDAWVGIIDRGENLLEYLRKRRPDLTPAHVAARVMRVQGDKKPGSQNSVREQLHGGDGRPLLPGSSLKGALRTALLTEKIDAKPNFVKQDQNLKDQKGKLKDRNLQQHYLSPTATENGEAPNRDVLRLLQCGDFAFADPTVCLLAETLNQKGNGLELKRSVQQFIECMPKGVRAAGRLRVPEDLKNQIEQRRYLPTDGLVLGRILKTTHDHNMKLLTREVDYWEKESSALPNGADRWVEHLKAVKTQADGMSEREYLVRVGFGVGFLTMTGRWQHDHLTDDAFDALENQVRGSRYTDYPLPKSRKLTPDAVPLGFVKLALSDRATYEQLAARPYEPVPTYAPTRPAPTGGSSPE
ncbi:MAG: type III-A CRISPR-associated RAMP protein Csm5, partial [Catalinimonas sp.]